MPVRAFILMLVVAFSLGCDSKEQSTSVRKGTTPEQVKVPMPDDPGSSATAASFQEHAVSFWKSVEQSDANLCEALTRLTDVPDRALREAVYEPVAPTDTDMVIDGAPVAFGSKTLRRIEAALKSCPELQSPDTARAAMLRLDDLYAAMMLNMWSDSDLNHNLMPSPYIFATTSRLWILGQIRDRTSDAAERKRVQNKIDLLADISRQRVSDYTIP